MDSYVLDTTAFTEARLRTLFNTDSLEAVVAEIAGLIRDARLTLNARFYMTPNTWSELRRILLGSGVSINTVQELSAWITVKAPSKLQLSIPASVFSEYVSDIRRRFFRGLRVAETALRRAARECGSSEECIGEAIKGLREKYREATRKGLVDSVEDLDTILLAVEIKGIVVTSDQGIRKLSEQLGIIVVDPEDFVNMLRRMITGARTGQKPIKPEQEQ
ncbi:MAG: RNA ligase partner protein [Desulfurococcales archaeon]|nr:RNA ligase partner protein [Desulfurococcales archaeon]